MKRTSAIALTLLAIWVVPPVAEALTIPPVTEATAVEMTRGQLRRHPGWSFRTDGYIDCRGGHINRIHWRCRFAWIQGRKRCRIGRALVEGTENVEHINYYKVHMRIYACHLGSS